jgi:hypothetical protein
VARPAVQAQRRRFLRRIRAIAVDHLVFLDESGVHAAMSRSHTWVKRGTEYIDRVPMNRGKMLTLLGAIRLELFASCADGRRPERRRNSRAGPRQLGRGAARRDVEASRPALIEKVRTVVTDEQGQHEIVDFRPGVYTVTMSLPG